MTVRKDEPMDHLAATDEEFDALLDASSLGAPHVVAESGDIPGVAQRRMAQALHQQRRSPGIPDSTNHPQLDEADSQPGGPAEEERAERKIQTVHFFGAIGTGKSALFAALEHYLPSSTSSTRRYQLLGRQPWSVPSTPVLLPSALRFSYGLEEATQAGRPRRRVPSGDAALVLYPPRRNGTQPTRGRLATAWCRTSPAAQDAAFVVYAYRSAMQLLWPDRTAETPQGLQASGWPWARQRLRNLRDLIEPSVQPERPLFNITPTGLLACPAAPPAHLHVARFTSYAYAAAGGGLLVPRADSVPRERRVEAGTARCELKEPTRASGMMLRRKMVDGRPQLSAELPMLFHFDEHESLALTSDLQTRLTYRALDPYAVEARFRTDDHRETVWIFARDLLKNGLERRDGLGDVAVWPGNGMIGEPRVFLRISSPEGSALLSAADTDVRAFLEAIGGLVAYGAEHLHLAPALNALEATIGELARPGRRD
ncbi:SsgA family sporulation/cell division regulator [Streptomyces chartreusis]|uniref:SsgA family sporulation/cell division regulator n=1 Tax=Streptomyces chartreusis TaxID=1969 RepID=UPI00381BDED1